MEMNISVPTLCMSIVSLTSNLLVMAVASVS